MFLDTPGLLCLQDRAERHHDVARDAYRAARSRLTHPYVLAEYVALAHSRRRPRDATLALLRDLLDNPGIETVWVDEALHREPMGLLSARRDKTYSLCDAVSFLLMSRRKMVEAPSTDHRFEQEGLRRLLT